MLKHVWTGLSESSFEIFLHQSLMSHTAVAAMAICCAGVAVYAIKVTAPSEAPATQGAA